MPRNTTGGNKHKKGKNIGRLYDTKIQYAVEGQIYALVKKRLGGTRILLYCSDDKERHGIIPGKMKRKQWMNSGDILLCNLNIDGDDSICYIINKYSAKHANILRFENKIFGDHMQQMQQITEKEKEKDNNTGYSFDADEVGGGNEKKPQHFGSYIDPILYPPSDSDELNSDELNINELNIDEL